MKKTTGALKPCLSGALLISSLTLLSGCNWFKQSECPSCEQPAATVAPSSEDVLLEIDGKPIITKEKFDTLYDMAVATDPQSAFSPGMAQKVFSYLEQAALMDASIKKSKKDQDPEYKKKIEQTFELARASVNGEVFQKEILDSIDVSNGALEAFYKEQVSKNPAFQNPPFMVKAGGIKVQAVTFNDDKSASAFLAKVQKPGADFASIAKADKKEVQDLGIVSPQSKVDRALVARAKDLQPNMVEKVPLSNGKVMVVKGVGPREAVEYMKFSDIMAEEYLENYLKQIKQSAELQPLMAKKFEELKKELNVKQNTHYIEEKEAKQNADLEALIKSMRGPQEEKKAENKAGTAPENKAESKAESPKSM